jgi:predicted dehydrogenase
MRLAFIGGWGHANLRPALNDPAIQIDRPVAVATDGHDADQARKLAANLGTPTTFYDSIDAMLDEYKPDVVNVGAVYGYNGDVIAEVLRRGISVASDKPIAATWDQLAELKRLTAGGKTKLITEFLWRSHTELRSARDAIAAGEIGEVVLATAQKSYRFGTGRPAWYGDRKAFGSTLLWVAGHGIDAVRYVTGQQFTRVTARHGNVSRKQLPELEDHVVTLYALSGGGTAAIHADYQRPDKAASHGDDRVRVVGSRGLIELRDGRCKLTTNDAPEIDISDRATVRPSHVELLAALSGEDESIYSTAESLYLAEVLLHSRDAADGEKWIDLTV